MTLKKLKPYGKAVWIPETKGKNIFFQYFDQSQKRLINQQQNMKNRVKEKKRHSKEKNWSS